jgi:hypothetical protein
VFLPCIRIALAVLRAPKREGISASVGYRLILEPWATMCVYTPQRSHPRRTSCPMKCNHAGWPGTRNINRPDAHAESPTYRAPQFLGVADKRKSSEQGEDLVLVQDLYCALANGNSATCSTVTNSRIGPKMEERLTDTELPNSAPKEDAIFFFLTRGAIEK